MNTPSSSRHFAWLLWLLAALSLPALADDATPSQLKGFPTDTLSIVRKDGRDDFRIWIADTSQRQQQGLMFIQSLSADRGMLFPLEQPRVMTMWMKNTYIPLDMVFIAADGRVSSVAANTRPLSEAIVSSGVPIAAVLELKAGEAQRRGIRAGDRVLHSSLPTP